MIENTKKQAETYLGKSTKTTFEFNNKNIKIECLSYTTKKGIYNVSYSNNFVTGLVLYPNIKQSFSSLDFWTGGIFEIENNELGGCVRNTSQGKENGINYYIYSFECDAGSYFIKISSDKNGIINKISIF